MESALERLPTSRNVVLELVIVEGQINSWEILPREIVDDFSYVSGVTNGIKLFIQDSILKDSEEDLA